MAAQKKKSSGTSAAKRKTAAGKASAGKKKNTGKKRASEPSLVFEMKKVITGLAVLFVFIAMVAMVADFYLRDHGSRFIREYRRKGGEPAVSVPPSGGAKDGTLSLERQPEPGHKSPLPGLQAKGTSLPEPGNAVAPSRESGHSPGKVSPSEEPIFEVFDPDYSHLPGRPGRVPPPEVSGLPCIAVIIDDIGQDMNVAMAFARLDREITLSILPGLAQSRRIARNLHIRDMEVMLHLPMEPVQYPEVNPGQGALLAHMTPDLLIATLRRDLDQVPYVVGVNNHMGSRLTTMSDQMRQVFTVLKKRKLFFIDSLTARQSACKASAALFQLPFARRDVFLDNVQETAYISRQLDELVRIGRRHGSAIGIGHPYPATLETLETALPRLRKAVRMVRASRLVMPSP